MEFVHCVLCSCADVSKCSIFSSFTTIFSKKWKRKLRNLKRWYLYIRIIVDDNLNEIIISTYKDVINLSCTYVWKTIELTSSNGVSGYRLRIVRNQTCSKYVVKYHGRITPKSVVFRENAPKTCVSRRRRRGACTIIKL